MAADHESVHADDVHDVVEPAGAVAPSMKTAALVVPGEMYAGLRTLRDARGAGGIRIVMVPLAVRPAGAAGPGLATACATALRPTLEPPPTHESRPTPRTITRATAEKRARRFISGPGRASRS
jgi:hypothetical protein